ncbi:MAG: hypothetical protein GHCLOJNM_00261 [bacterium]|nr:hypothetical protein [bacterium]
MAEIAFELLVICLLVLLNGVFAMTEIATLSARRARLERRALEGDRGAKAALDLLDEPDRFLSTVQIGITLVGILAGAYGGATLAKKLEEALGAASYLLPYAQGLSIGIVVILVTYLSLVVGELVPKQLALRHAESIAANMARPMQLISRLASPGVSLLSRSSNLILRLLCVRRGSEPTVTEDELHQMIRQARAAGVIQPAEQELVERTMVVADLRITSVMTPRTSLVYLDLCSPPKENWRKVIDSGHSYFPVCEDNIDNVVGVVSVKSLWAQIADYGSVNLRGVMEKPLFMPEAMSVLRGLESLKSSLQPVALVLDEYGGVSGMVTLSDFTKIILLGVHPQSESEDPWMVQREDGSWLLGGTMPIKDFRQAFSLANMPQIEEAGYQTLGGFVMLHLNKVPSESDCFEWGGLRFEVVDVDGLRVDKVLVSKIGKEEGDS